MLLGCMSVLLPVGHQPPAFSFQCFMKCLICFIALKTTNSAGWSDIHSIKNNDLQLLHKLQLKTPNSCKAASSIMYRKCSSPFSLVVLN
ncbi:hypothetical protein CMV_004305 [Castanea mollissima]|uniref:Uncharacterized protein n=1 Tax=Castanea mollissima TaxID=60419 RepID=A0A8J4RYM8_9ROSI|nr:hypothetical protein CMV_004305 [Castanea mollissima]